MRLVIFDMDGTLIDSEALIVETVTAAFETVGETPPSDEAIRSISGITAREAIGILAPHAAAPRLEEIVSSFSAEYEKRAGRGRQPLFDGALAAIDRLQARRDLVLAVATGKGYDSAITLLTAHRILDRFGSVQTPDHNRGKPDPQMIETAMAHAAATPAETVMIGDTVHDMQMAKAAGVAAIGVGWGYHGVDDLRAAGADVVIARFDELDGAVRALIG